MQTSSRDILLMVTVVLAIALALFLASHFSARGIPSAPPEGQAATSSQAATTSSSSDSVAITTIGSSAGDYTVTEVPVSHASPASAAPAAPSYTKPLSFSAATGADVRASLESQFAALQEKLAAHPGDLNNWLMLGILRKQAGDYQGAAEDWTYVARANSQNAAAYADLGDLYANYLGNPAQSISYFTQAIHIDPTQAVFYENLAAVYEHEGDMASARATLQQGIDAKVRGYQNLQSLLDSLAQQ